MYNVLTNEPGGCIKFHGITLLSNASDPSRTLCFVFERATRGTIIEYIEAEGTRLGWYEVIGMFTSIASALDNALHRKNVVHRYEYIHCR